MARIVNPRRFIISSLVAILLVGLGGYKIYQTGLNYWGYGNSTFEKIATISFDKNSDNGNQLLVIPFNDMLGMYYNNSLRAFTLDGEEKWNLGQKISNPALFGDDENLYLVDTSAGYINSIDQKGEIIWTKDVAQTIQKFKVNKSNIAMAVEGENEESYVLVFDKEGKELGVINIKSGTIIDLATTIDGEIVALSVLTTDRNVIETNIILYSKEGKLLGGNKYDEEIIGSMFFTDDNSLLSVGVDNIVSFHKEKGLLWKKDALDSINKTAWNGENHLAINYITKKNSILDIGHKSYISVIDKEGQKIVELPLKEMAIDMDFHGDKVIVAGERTLYFAKKLSEEVEDKRINKDIKEVLFLNETQIAVIMENGIDIFKME